MSASNCGWKALAALLSEDKNAQLRRDLEQHLSRALDFEFSVFCPSKHGKELAYFQELYHEQRLEGWDWRRTRPE